MNALDNATQIALNAIWANSVKEAISASISLKEEKEYETLLSAMEEGLLAPQPWELPDPPVIWIQ